MHLKKFYLTLKCVDSFRITVNLTECMTRLVILIVLNHHEKVKFMAIFRSGTHDLQQSHPLDRQWRSPVLINESPSKPKFTFSGRIRNMESKLILLSLKDSSR